MSTISPSLSVSTCSHGQLPTSGVGTSACEANAPTAAVLSQDSTEVTSMISSDASDDSPCSKGCDEHLETPEANNKRPRLVDNPCHCTCSDKSTVQVEASPLLGMGFSLGKREDYLSWEEYFLATAKLSSLRSKDPYHPSGACLVDADNRIVGIGYNGFPSGFPDDQLSWEPPSGTAVPWLDSREPFVIHAEVNCLLNSARASNLTLYCVDFPCHDCAKFIVQSRRVSKVVYGRRLSLDDSVRVSHILLQQAGIDVQEYHLKRPIELRFSNATSETKPEDSFLSWDEYFMAMALLTSRRSKDPNTQVGACIVSPRRIILACGYNGFTAGCSDDAFPWQRSANDPKHTKYMYVCHAEVNALLNCQVSHLEQQGSTLYVTLFPCYQCAQALVQAGTIRRVVYLHDPYHDDVKFQASRKIFDMAGVAYEEFQPRRSLLILK